MGNLEVLSRRGPSERVVVDQDRQAVIVPGNLLPLVWQLEAVAPPAGETKHLTGHHEYGALEPLMANGILLTVGDLAEFIFDRHSTPRSRGY
jgi:hypothetical protein